MWKWFRPKWFSHIPGDVFWNVHGPSPGFHERFTGFQQKVHAKISILQFIWIFECNEHNLKMVNQWLSLKIWCPWIQRHTQIILLTKWHCIYCKYYHWGWFDTPKYHVGYTSHQKSRFAEIPMFDDFLGWVKTYHVHPACLIGIPIIDYDSDILW